MARTKTTPRKMKTPVSREFISSSEESINTSKSSTSSNITNHSGSNTSLSSSSSSCSTCSSTTCSTCSSDTSCNTPQVSSSTSTVDYTNQPTPIPKPTTTPTFTVNTSPVPGTSKAPPKVRAPPSISRFSCNLCPKTFTRLQSLRRHVNSIHMDRGTSYQCPVCDKRLTRSDSLKAHMKRVHYMTDTPQVLPTRRPTVEDTIIPITEYVKPWESLTLTQQLNPTFRVRKATPDYHLAHKNINSRNNPGYSILYKDPSGHYYTKPETNTKPTAVKNLYGVYTTKPPVDLDQLREDLQMSDTDSVNSDLHPNDWDPEDFLILDEC